MHGDDSLSKVLDLLRSTERETVRTSLYNLLYSMCKRLGLRYDYYI